MKDIAGYEGLYAVTSCGRVWSYKRKTFLKNFNDDRGYKMVKLYKNGKSHTDKIHRLVAETYIPNPNNLPEVNHIDENKEHNYINNLEWCTTNYNVRYSKIKGKIICIETGEIFDCAQDVGKLYNDRCHIHEHLKGKIKSYHGLHYERVD